MTTYYALIALCLLLWAKPAIAEQTIDSRITIGQSTIHFGVYENKDLRLGDVLYFHGLGDRFQNHEALFAEWNAAGFRVISFDLPSHGESSGTAIGGIDFHSFDSLTEIAQVVLRTVRSASDSKPLFLAGWSLGGLIAARITQSEELRLGFPPVAGLILYAPAIATRTCVGFLCQITNETLTHNQSLFEREIKPDKPLLHLPFGSRLILAAAGTWRPPLPAELQTLIILASEADAYVHTALVVKWVGTHRSNYVSRISAYRCKDAKHELDNEPEAFGGNFVRQISTDFVARVSQGERWEEASNFSNLFIKPCERF